MANEGNRLLIVSNRLPVRLERSGEEWKVRPGEGGLVTAMAPVLRNRGGIWIGWPGTDEPVDLDSLLKWSEDHVGYRLRPVPLTAEEREKFYLGFSNEILWPLFHDMQTMCNFDPEYWEVYRKVNRKFAESILSVARKDDFIWIHDYHLINTARILREAELEAHLGFFLHTPFPPLDVFLKLPWRFEILESLLHFDLVGFQTNRDRRNFLQCIRLLFPGTKISGKGRVTSVSTGNRDVRVAAFPISIDFDDFAGAAAAREVADAAWFIHEDLPGRTIILGVDRLDYTKGLPYKLKAFRRALIEHSELHGKVTFVQIVVPSRENIPRYRELKEEVELLVSDINGRFTRSGWVPVHYMFRSLSRSELLAYYRTAEIALVTPLKDGMNLVAKEYCACSLENDGVLILSEFAGAASQLWRHALLVNPFDVIGMADAIFRAFSMDGREKADRMRRLRKSIRQNNIFRWVDSFLRAAISQDLSSFPVIEEYVPHLDPDEEYPRD